MKLKQRKKIEENFINTSSNRREILDMGCSSSTLYHIGLLFYYYIYYYSKIDKYGTMTRTLAGYNPIFQHIKLEDRFYINDIRLKVPRIAVRRINKSGSTHQFLLYWEKVSNPIFLYEG